MSEFALQREFGRIESQTRRSMGVSIALHVLLFLLLGFYHASGGESVGLTEITWVEEAMIAGVVDAAPPVAEKETKSAPVQEVKSVATREAENAEHYERSLERGEVAPRPQSSRSVTDILDERISTMQNDAKDSATRLASLVPPPKVGIPAPAGVPSPDAVGSGTSPSSLRREGGPSGVGSGPPSALKRAGVTPSRPIPVAVAGAPPTAAATPDAASSNKTRELAGARIIGPVADRAVESYQVPVYPEWAKKEGIEGSVTLYFFVLPDGRVKENILVEKTSGFTDFDNGAVAALLQWKFVAMPGANEQWGRITFNYRLGDAR